MKSIKPVKSVKSVKMVGQPAVKEYGQMKNQSKPAPRGASVEGSMVSKMRSAKNKLMKC